jgi:hypothetical protein
MYTVCPWITTTILFGKGLMLPTKSLSGCRQNLLSFLVAKNNEHFNITLLFILQVTFMRSLKKAPAAKTSRNTWQQNVHTLSAIEFIRLVVEYWDLQMICNGNAYKFQCYKTENGKSSLKSQALDWLKMATTGRHFSQCVRFETGFQSQFYNVGA